VLPPALSEPRRQQILRFLWSAERRAGDIAASMPDISFPAVSQHLATLHAAGLVSRRRQGREIFYAVNRDALGPLAAALDQMWSDQLTTLKNLAEAEESRQTARGAARKKTAKRSSAHARRQRRR
jgi:DNA-binding transcriptional ArsR family regulator